MSRAHLDYGAQRESALRFAGHDPDTPVAGHYRMRLRSGGVFVGVRVWHGPPHDPVTGEEMDRSWRWQAEIDGRPADLADVWPKCAGDPIDAAEYQFLAARRRWGEENAPDSPQADPRRRIDPLTAPLPF